MTKYVVNISKKVELYFWPQSFWIGFYYNKLFETYYIQPLPMVGIRVDAERNYDED